MMLKPWMMSGIILLALGSFFGYHKIYLVDQQAIHQVSEESRQAQELQRVRSHLAESIERAEQYRKHLAPHADVEWLVQEIGRIARETGVQLSQIDPQRPREIDGYTQLSVTLQLTSSYHTLGHFLSKIESSPRIIQVDQLDLSRVSQDATDRTSVRLQLSTLYAAPLAGRSP